MPIDALDVLTDVAVVAAEAEAVAETPVDETPVHPLAYMGGPFGELAKHIIDLEIAVAALKGVQS